MKHPMFYRSAHAHDHLEVFLVSAVSSLLTLRFYLYVAGYPQVGTGSLHIAHMLYGGLLMMAAIVIALSFLGNRVQRLSALLGGVGFGIFIDELGKFITRDNNYFFKPTVGIIYAIFISLYLLFNFLTRSTKLSNREYQLNALDQFEEAVCQDLDSKEKQQIKVLLNKADQNSPITQELQLLLSRLDTVPSPMPGPIRRFIRAMDKQYKKFWHQRHSNQLISVLFVVEAGLFLIGVLGSIIANFDSVQELLAVPNTYGQELIIGQLIASLVAAGFAVLGAGQLRFSRLHAFEQFRRATLINLFLTEFFIFSRIQFGAIPSFTANLILLAALHYAIYQEQHHVASENKA